jgi:hypothetical protein
VLATDWSPAMIERFEARVRDEGLSTAVGRVMDAHDLKIEDDTRRRHPDPREPLPPHRSV